VSGEGPGLVDRVSEEEAVDEGVSNNKNSFLRMIILPVVISRPNTLLSMLINELRFGSGVFLKGSLSGMMTWMEK